MTAWGQSRRLHDAAEKSGSPPITDLATIGRDLPTEAALRLDGLYGQSEKMADGAWRQGSCQSTPLQLDFRARPRGKPDPETFDGSPAAHRPRANLINTRNTFFSHHRRFFFRLRIARLQTNSVRVWRSSSRSRCSTGMPSMSAAALVDGERPDSISIKTDPALLATVSSCRSNRSNTCSRSHPQWL
jgi:hypothetical protein